MTNKHKAIYVGGIGQEFRKELKTGDAFGNGWVFDSVTDDGKNIVTRSIEHGTTMRHMPNNIGCEIHKFTGTIDLTPTWRAVLPILVEVAGTAERLEARQEAMKELQRMADLADAYVKEHKQ